MMKSVLFLAAVLAGSHGIGIRGPAPAPKRDLFGNVCSTETAYDQLTCPCNEIGQRCASNTNAICAGTTFGAGTCMCEGATFQNSAHVCQPPFTITLPSSFIFCGYPAGNPYPGNTLVMGTLPITYHSPVSPVVTCTVTPLKVTPTDTGTGTGLHLTVDPSTAKVTGVSTGFSPNPGQPGYNANPNQGDPSQAPLSMYTTVTVTCTDSRGTTASATTQVATKGTC